MPTRAEQKARLKRRGVVPPPAELPMWCERFMRWLMYKEGYTREISVREFERKLRLWCGWHKLDVGAMMYWLRHGGYMKPSAADTYEAVRR